MYMQLTDGLVVPAGDDIMVNEDSYFRINMPVIHNVTDCVIKFYSNGGRKDVKLVSGRYST